MAFPRIVIAVLIVSAFSPTLLFGEDRISGTSGDLRIHYFPIPATAKNPWSEDLENGFWKRANWCFSKWKFQGKYGNTYFENEKASYPRAFIDFIQGNREPALKFLQAEDGDPHAKKATLGVDWYPSFTIKSQVRKYFFFGEYLDPAYRKKMKESAKLWTEKDPLNRPNDFYQGKKEGWNVESKNSWVDVRNTDNLRAMRECSVYLMAEETGNSETTKLYKERIQAYVKALYSTGMGEWDSANYLHHGTTAWFQLYDFAKDPEVRMLGKAVLDWICANAALKYYRGNWAGPNKRDYNNVPQFAGAPGSFWIYFNDTPNAPEDPDHDLVHWITSPYRPPEAVVGLAKKDFAKPVEILASRPSYDGWYKEPGGEDAPMFHETIFISRDFQVGTLPGGHEGDVCGFRMATSNPSTGSDLWILSTALKGYVDGIATGTVGGDRIAQSKNLIIYANPQGETPFYFLAPKSAKLSEQKGISFFDAGPAWLAVTPVSAQVKGWDTAATQTACAGKRPMPDQQVWTAQGKGGGPTALILEIGDASSHPNFEAFKKAVLEKSRPDLSKLASGEIHYQGSTGGSVGLLLTGEALPTVFRDGQEHDWKNHWALFSCAAGSKSEPIRLGWKDGVLRVAAGDKTFTGTFQDGRYSFSNE